jgi:chlorobactene glucosyltransferase
MSPLVTPVWPWLLLALPPLLPLCITLFNLLTWSRGRPGTPTTRSVSVLIPARNEENSIEAAVRSVLEGTQPIHEVIVCDDGSSDATPQILAALSSLDPRLRVLAGAPLPSGWIGKPHACHQLAEAATGELLLFMDADVCLRSDGLERVSQLLEEKPAAQVLTAVPRQRMGSFVEGLMMPLLHLSYTAWLPLRLIPLVSDPRVLAANGQILAVERDTYDRVGGFAAVRAEVVDDMAFCRRVKEHGGRVRFADGHDLATCRMYDSGAQLWSGFAKNLYEGVGGTPQTLAMVLALHVVVWVLPWFAALIGAFTGDTTLLVAGAVGAAAGVMTRLLLGWRLSHPLWSAFLHPAAIVGFVGIGLQSWAWSRRDAITWAGRSYAGRARRGGGTA